MLPLENVPMATAQAHVLDRAGLVVGHGQPHRRPLGAARRVEDRDGLTLDVGTLRGAGLGPGDLVVRELAAVDEADGADRGRVLDRPGPPLGTPSKELRHRTTPRAWPGPHGPPSCPRA